MDLARASPSFFLSPPTRVAPYGKKVFPLAYLNFKYIRRRGMLELHLTAITCNSYILSHRSHLSLTEKKQPTHIYSVDSLSFLRTVYGQLIYSPRMTFLIHHKCYTRAVHSRDFHYMPDRETL